MGGFKRVKIPEGQGVRALSTKLPRLSFNSVSKISHLNTPRSPTSFRYRYYKGDPFPAKLIRPGITLLGEKPTWVGPVALAESPTELQALGNGLRKFLSAIGHGIKTAWNYWWHRPAAFGLLMAIPPKENGKDAEFLSQSFSQLDLPETIGRPLRLSGMETIAELVKMTDRGLQRLRFNENQIKVIKEKLAEHGLTLGMDIKSFTLSADPKEPDFLQPPPTLYKEPVLQEAGGKYYSIFFGSGAVAPWINRQVEGNPHTRVGRVKEAVAIEGTDEYRVTFATQKLVEMSEKNPHQPASSHFRDLSFQMGLHDFAALNIENPEEFFMFYPRDERMGPAPLNFTSHLFNRIPMNLFLPEFSLTNLSPKRFLMHLSQTRINLKALKDAIPQQESYESMVKGLEEIKEVLVNHYEFDISPDLLERYSWGMAQTRLLESMENVMHFLDWTPDELRSFFFHRNPVFNTQDRILIISYLGFLDSPELPYHFKSVVKFLGALSTLSVYLQWDFKSMVHEVLAETTDPRLQNHILRAMGRLGLIY